MEEKSNCTRRVAASTRDTYVEILRRELIPATGCTEPIALAYAAAKAAEVLGKRPERLDVLCSGNMIKNVKAVNVPCSGGLRGIEAAALLGAVGGDAAAKLNVLLSVTDEHRAAVREMLSQHLCSYAMAENVPNLYIKVTAISGGESAGVTIENKHDNITLIERNGEVLFEAKAEEAAAHTGPDMGLLNVADILAFARDVEVEAVADIVLEQAKANLAISEEGLSNPYGLEVGRTLLRQYGESDVRIRARARAAAGSDARMSGCPMPVVINSGSGNQGMTVSLPVLVYAQEYNATREQLVRALVVANLISLHQKRYIGSLSAYCGAVSASVGAVCGIAWLRGDSYEVIAGLITNTTAAVSGMVCDGAKPSCAAKISAALGAALDGWALAEQGHVCLEGEGMVAADVEGTIQNIGRMGREGMRSTDREILLIMTGK